MASPHLYVRSTDGSDADNGTTWALAKATLAGAAAIDSTTDNRIWVSQAHAESSAASQSIALAGTSAIPTWVVAANDGAEPPTAVSTASITTTGASNITFTGSCYVYGLTMNTGTGANAAVLNINNGFDNQVQHYTNCKFNLVATGASNYINIGASANIYAPVIRWENCDVSFAAATQGIAVNLAEFIWNGGVVTSGSTALTGGLLKFITSGEYTTALISGVDLSNLGTASYLVSAGGGTSAEAIFRNCKLPASWTGGPVTGTLRIRDRIAMYNCDNADTNYRLWIETYGGSVKHETTIVRTGGANDGTTTVSWKMASSANAEYPAVLLDSPEIVKWNETTGSAITATIEIVTDNVTLNDDECWIDVQYLGTSGFPLSLYARDSKADVLATAQAQTTSSETWTTTGLGTPVKQKLSVTFTPQEKGFLHAIVRVAKASTTVYVDPLLTIT